MKRRALRAAWWCLVLAVPCAADGWGGGAAPAAAVPESPRAAPEVLLAVPFVPQETSDDCGIAALQSVYRYHGLEVGRGDLMTALGYQEGKGVLNLRVVLDARRRGLAAVLAKGSRDRLAELLREKVPPLLMVERKRQNHFLVVTGLRPGAIRCHTSTEENRWEPEAEFLAAWERTGGCLVEIRSEGEGKR